MSIGTVDRVLHKRGEVSPATKDLIMRIMGELDYKPNILARTLALKKPHNFAILFPQPQSPEGYWTKPVKGVRKAYSELQEYGVRVSVFQYSHNDPASFSEKAEAILKYKPEGVVLAPFFSRESMVFVKQLDDLGIPYVFIDSNIDSCNKISYVGQNSFQCGTLAARLFDFSLSGTANILVVHFAKARDNQNHLMQRESGFYNYFKVKGNNTKLLKTIDIENPEDSGFYSRMDKEFLQKGGIQGIFVTNSQVYRVASYFVNRNINGVRLIGHDFIKKNKEFVNRGIVDFLICQRPEEQGYRAIETLFRYLVHKEDVTPENYTPIDIITKENMEFYKEFNL